MYYMRTPSYHQEKFNESENDDCNASTNQSARGARKS
ncbi:hypothetical protein AAKU58_004234 [Oxalobacteraceae bacterium GrIS 1.18]